VEKCGDNVIRRMRVVCWLTKAIDKHSESVNTYCFSAATRFSCTRLSVALYVHCLLCQVHKGVHNGALLACLAS
jgi:hypothetical protein